MAQGGDAPDWARIQLVAFDVDGTLYRQRSLRLRMARDLLIETLTRGDVTALRVLRTYRRLREAAGEAEEVDFEASLVARTAAVVNVSAERVSAVVAEWIDRRPLRRLAACRYRGLTELFDGLRRRGVTIGVVSDYPAQAKLEALGLRADHVVYAGEAEVGVLKPHPRGLQVLMARAGVAPSATLLIGDRPERDGLAARRAGAHVLIRSSRTIDGWPTIAGFDDPAFATLLAA